MYRRCRNLWTYNSLSVESSVHETKWATREDGTIEFCFRTFTVKISVISQNCVIKSLRCSEMQNAAQKTDPHVCAFFISTWGHSTGILFEKLAPRFYGSSTKAYALFLPRTDSREAANGRKKHTTKGYTRRERQANSSIPNFVDSNKKETVPWKEENPWKKFVKCLNIWLSSHN